MTLGVHKFKDSTPRQKHGNSEGGLKCQVGLSARSAESFLLSFFQGLGIVLIVSLRISILEIISCMQK